jgi:hypothetical protein
MLPGLWLKLATMLSRVDTSTVTSSWENVRVDKRIMAYTAAAMYGAGVLDGLIEGFLPDARPFARAPVVAVLVASVTLSIIGPRMPRWGLALLGPFGVALVGYALATTPGAGDGAVLYALPVLWMTLFFGRRGAITVVACVGVAHAVALLSLPAASAYPGRWLDVMASVSAICVVVLVLERTNRLLLTRLAGEATTDPLTGLLNRRGFADRASVELVHARRDGIPIGLAALDIDHFKRVNDQWGHGVGDRREKVRQTSEIGELKLQADVADVSNAT